MDFDVSNSDSVPVMVFSQSLDGQTAYGLSQYLTIFLDSMNLPSEWYTALSAIRNAAYDQLPDRFEIKFVPSDE